MSSHFVLDMPEDNIGESKNSTTRLEAFFASLILQTVEVVTGKALRLSTARLECDGPSRHQWEGQVNDGIFRLDARGEIHHFEFTGVIISEGKNNTKQCRVIRANGNIEREKSEPQELFPAGQFMILMENLQYMATWDPYDPRKFANQVEVTEHDKKTGVRYHSYVGCSRADRVVVD